jgi:inorganic phosphate transporter, PiT family
LAQVLRCYDRLSIVSACFMAFNHGLNDGQKFMGVFAMTLFAGKAIPEFTIPYWVIFLCAATMGIGTSAGGWRIIKTVGAKMTKLQSWQGFAAQTAASCTIFAASTYGIPLSTTHTITSGIVGAAASRRISDVHCPRLDRHVSGLRVCCLLGGAGSKRDVCGLNCAAAHHSPLFSSRGPIAYVAKRAI